MDQSRAPVCGAGQTASSSMINSFDGNAYKTSLLQRLKNCASTALHILPVGGAIYLQEMLRLTTGKNV